MLKWEYYQTSIYTGEKQKETLSLYSYNLEFILAFFNYIDKQNLSINEKEKCKKKNNEWEISINENILEKQGKNIYIKDIIYEASWPDIKPYKFNSIEYCRVENKMMHKISISNNKEWNKKEYLEKTINSLKFLQQK